MRSHEPEETTLGPVRVILRKARDVYGFGSDFGRACSNTKSNELTFDFAKISTHEHWLHVEFQWLAPSSTNPSSGGKLRKLVFPATEVQYAFVEATSPVPDTPVARV